ncbi:ROK family protein [Pedobacter sp. KBS0701]|uniref:ROK family protein n=1 Tax=Pedobacter sp. KBS0701 TaxID=2578106 RepID=UPI00110D59D6|nr:ROK family protein [Pedobacter sp. KBS0701]QDW23932.1 ROK family protein [Pedobacter sp. KBS0701]
MHEHIILGADIGGSHITAALVDVKSGILIPGSTNRAKVDSKASPSHIIQSWCKVIAKSLNSAAHSGRVAIAMPGPFDYEKGIAYMKGMDKYDALYGMDIRELMLAELGQIIIEIHFINDAGCFLQGELTHGKASAYNKVMGFTLGTGFGSAKGVGGKATDADYWQYPFMGGICENFFSSRWFTAKYAVYSGLDTPNVKHLIEAADTGGALLQLFDEFSMNFGIFLSQIYKKENFDCIVLGGNISNAWTLFLPQLLYYLDIRSVSAPVYISSQGESAALIGAACSI